MTKTWSGRLLPRVAPANAARVTAAALIMQAMALVAAGPAVAETVRVRSAPHDGYFRLVFDWPAPVGYEARVDGDILVVRFDRAIESDFSRVLQTLGDVVASAQVDADGQTVRVALTAPHTVRHFVLDNAVVVDASPVGADVAAAAAAAAAVRVRAGEHEGFSRLVFDWPETVPYDIENSGDRARLTFARPATFDLSAVIASRPPGLNRAAADGSAGADGAAVDLELDAGVSVRTFRDGPRVVVDLLLDGAQPAPEAAPAIAAVAADEPVAEPEQEAADGSADTVTVDTVTVDTATADTATVDTATADTVTPDTAADLAAANHTAVDDAVAQESGADDVQPVGAPVALAPPADEHGSDAPVSTRTVAAAEHRAEELAVLAEPTAGAGGSEKVALLPAPRQQVAAVDGLTVRLRRGPPAADLSDLPEIEASYEGDSGGGAFSFGLSRPSAAVFRRGGYLWIVLSEAGRVDTEALAAQAGDVVVRIAQLAVDTATVLRLETMPGFNPAISQTKDGLTLALRVQKLAPKTAVEILAGASDAARVDVEHGDATDGDSGNDAAGQSDHPDDAAHGDAGHGDDSHGEGDHVNPASGAAPRGAAGDGVGAAVLVALKNAQEPLLLVDPEIGDVLTVVPGAVAGLGVAGTREFVAFRLKETAQGVVVVPSGDDVAVVRVDGGVIVSGGAGAVSSQAERKQIRDAAGGPDVLPRLFDFAAWRHDEAEDYAEARQALLSQTAGVDGQDRNEARLELARFLFAQGRPEEAISVLAAINRDGHSMANAPDFRALRGASLLLLGRTEDATPDLIDSGLDSEPEIVLWRAALAAERGAWQEAGDGLREGELYAQRYPDRLRVRFSLLGADAMVRVDDPVGATAWLESLAGVELTPGESARRSLIEGRLSALEGEPELALAAYDKAVDSPDRLARAQATLARVRLGLETGAIDLANAIDQLDRLRFVWRGDDLELEILSTLGDLYIEHGQFRDGLQTLKRAATNFTEHPRVPQLTETMQTVFEDLFISGAADDLPTLQAIALFNQFRELTPAGDDGDDMIRKLAIRLVSVDLLEQAASLLTHQVDFRVEGEAKAEVGANLAGVHLLDRRPEAALEALAISEVAGVGAAIVAERKLLEAQAKAELGLVDDALAAIAADRSFDADQLRAEILWRARDWKRAAPVFARLVGPAPSNAEVLDDQRSRFVLNLAVSLSLSGDRRTLAQIRNDFGDAMRRSEFAYDFRVIAADDSDPADFESALARVESVDDFQSFLDNYRARLSGTETTG